MPLSFIRCLLVYIFSSCSGIRMLIRAQFQFLDGKRGGRGIYRTERVVILF